MDHLLKVLGLQCLARGKSSIKETLIWPQGLPRGIWAGTPVCPSSHAGFIWFQKAGPQSRQGGGGCGEAETDSAQQ